MEEEKKTNNYMVPLVIVGVLLVVSAIAGVFVLTSRNDNSQIATDTQSQTNLSTDSQVEGMMVDDSEGIVPTDSNEQTIEMEAGSFYYAPNEIRAKVGQTVRVVLTSKDMMHDFNIDELGVKLPITKAGETATVEFVASQEGEFEYYCSVGQHRANGQVGKLIVE